MEKPEEPKKEDCCNSGCNPCIFDIYEKQLKTYEKSLENGKQDTFYTKENGISQLEYTKFIVIRNVNLGNSHHLFIFKRSSNCKTVWWKPGDHFLFKYVSSELTCTRAYTPFKIKNEINPGDFAIIVKKYNNGIVSTYLCGLNEGCVTLWRGPYGQYELKPNKFKRIIMIAQGTGIAPFIHIIDSILNNEDDMTKIMLFYCCGNINTILFRDELYTYKSFWNFQYTIYTSTTPSNSQIRYQEPIKTKRLNSEDIFNLKPFLDNDQFLICGSQQFIENYDILIGKEISLKENIVLF